MKRIPILLYHDLDSPLYPNEKATSAGRETVVAVASFKGHMGFLLDNGYETLSLSEYSALTVDAGTWSSRKIIITFDDGHRSSYDLALPALQHFRLRATFFIVAGWIDSPGYLTSDQIRDLSAAGMEIGSHGMTHRFLPLLDDPTIQWELRESKRRLESVTARPVEFFAFAGGHYNSRVVRLLKVAGYRGACSCLLGFNSPRTDPYLLRRIEIRRRVQGSGLTFLIQPNRLYLDRIVDSAKISLRRTVGLRYYTYLRSRFFHLYPFRR